MAGLSSAAVTRNFPALPNDLDMTFLNESKAALTLGLNKKHGNDTEAKIASVNRILSKFKDGTIRSDLNCRENWWAAQLVLFELNGNKAIKEATA